MNERAVGRMVRYARRRAGLTQHALADASGVPQPTIARIESGAAMPRTSTLLALLETTGNRLITEPTGPGSNPDTFRRTVATPVPWRTARAVTRTRGSRRPPPMRLLVALRRFGVPFVLAGELAEVAHGAPLRGIQIVDVCIADTDTAAERLALTLAHLGADQETRPHRMPPIEGDHSTRFGRIRVRTRSTSGDPYETLIRNATWMSVTEGIVVRVAAPEDLARDRRFLGGEANLRAAATLQTLAEVESDR